MITCLSTRVTNFTIKNFQPKAHQVKWVHRKCSGILGSMYKVMKAFVCGGCMNPVASAGCTIVDNGVNANLKLVDKFCYLGDSDMLSVDRDADAAVETRI